MLRRSLCTKSAQKSFSHAMNIGKKAHLLVAQQVEGLLSIAPENKEVNTDVNVFFVPKSSDLLTAIKSQLPFSTCLNALKDFEADLCNHTFLYPVSDDEKTRALLIGLGESPEINEMSLRKAVDCAIKQLRQKVISEATFNLPNNLQSIPAIRTSQIIAQVIHTLVSLIKLPPLYYAYPSQQCCPIINSTSI